ncbi:hypothetical protein PIB30_079654 [Stylosanthes scabra]|uniref:Uncharacterized protein n=1 Tax=Stylosanthes scabra TaxID=79078 RepID=A0ABU6RR10_9FABA|nr:hypothetical protein [Stylosanthes scabra]
MLHKQHSGCAKLRAQPAALRTQLSGLQKSELTVSKLHAQQLKCLKVACAICHVAHATTDFLASITPCFHELRAQPPPVHAQLKPHSPFHAKFGAEVAKESARNEKITNKTLKVKSIAYAYAPKEPMRTHCHDLGVTS